MTVVEKWEKKKKLSTIIKMQDNINNTHANSEIENVRIVDITPTPYSVYLTEYYIPNILSIINFYNKLLINYNLFKFNHIKNYYLCWLLNNRVSFIIFKKKKNYRKRVFKKIKFLRFYKKLITHRKYRVKSIFYNLSTYSSTIIRKKILENILINKTPLSQKLLNTSFLEFFYKYNKNKHQHIPKNQYFGTLDNYKGNNYFTIFLRNYHQKPY
jgi:hypothetical protein